MPFVTQGEFNDCGAYCLCYLKWLTAGRDPGEELPKEQEDKDRAQIEDVYHAIQFGDASTGGVQPDYCDPMRMITLLRMEGTNSIFAIGEKSSMLGVFGAMNTHGAREYAFIQALTGAGGLCLRNPPLPGPGKAALAVYDVFNSEKILVGQHYLLFREKDGALYRYNPWDGVETDCAGYTEFTFTKEIRGIKITRTLRPADAAIVII